MGPTRGDDDQVAAAAGYAEALGRTIKVLRTDLGMERRELARAVGISYSYLTEIENGNKPPSASVLGSIAEALGMRMSQLIEAAEARQEREAQRALSMDLAETTAERRSSDDRLLDQGMRSPSQLRNEAAESLLQARVRHRPMVHRAEGLALQPSLRGLHRDTRAAVLELERLLRDMAPEDIERLLDFARRLAR